MAALRKTTALMVTESLRPPTALREVEKGSDDPQRSADPPVKPDRWQRLGPGQGTGAAQGPGQETGATSGPGQEPGAAQGPTQETGTRQGNWQRQRGQEWTSRQWAAGPADGAWHLDSHTYPWTWLETGVWLETGAREEIGARQEL